ncbi:MAG: hypothetical protein LBM93_05325 [Oscillospiraceae bacterium]|nr:hypothetical protein [Oscillospiraceae bacterium]
MGLFGSGGGSQIATPWGSAAITTTPKNDDGVVKGKLSFCGKNIVGTSPCKVCDKYHNKKCKEWGTYTCWYGREGAGKPAKLLATRTAD